MEYGYSDDIKMLKEGLESLLNKELTVEKFTNTVEGDGFSKELWRKIGENGWLSIQEDIKSLNDHINMAEIMYLSESFGKHLFPGPFSLVAGYIIPLLSKVNLTEEMAAILEKVKSGEKLVTTVVPKIVSAANNIEIEWPEVLSTKKADDIEVSGEIKQVQFGQHADYLLLPLLNEANELQLTFIDLKHESVLIKSHESLDLLKPKATIAVNKLNVSQSTFISGTDIERHAKEQLLNYLIYITGEMLGGVNEVLNRTVNYVIERKQFGVPIGSFQAVKHMIADMKVSIEKARSYSVYNTSQLGEEFNGNFVNLLSVYYFTSTIYKKVSEDAIQLHGGMGFTWEESIHYWYKTSMNLMYEIIHPTEISRIVLQSILETSKEPVKSV